MSDDGCWIRGNILLTSPPLSLSRQVCCRYKFCSSSFIHVRNIDILTECLNKRRTHFTSKSCFQQNIFVKIIQRNQLHFVNVPFSLSFYMSPSSIQNYDFNTPIHTLTKKENLSLRCWNISAISHPISIIFVKTVSGDPVLQYFRKQLVDLIFF